MKLHLGSLLQRRQLVLEQLQSIDRLRRGTLSQQFFRSLSDPSTKVGPYFVLQGFFHGRKFNERIPQEQAALVQEQVDNYRRFQSLAEEYVTLSDQITRLESQDSSTKKNSTPKRSTTNASRKPQPS